MLSSKFLKSTSGFALLASAPVLVSWAQGDVSSDVIGKASKDQSMYLMQEKVPEVAENSSFLSKFIWYAILTMAGVCILDSLEKGVVLLKNGLELRMNEDFVKYREDEGRLSQKKESLNSKKLELDRIKKDKENMVKEKERLEKEVEDLKSDPDLELLRPYVNAVKNKENEKFVKIFELRQALKEFWLLILEWTDQNGFTMKYPDFEQFRRSPFSSSKGPTTEQLTWLDGEFIAKVGDPLSYPEEMLGIELEKFQGEQHLFYSGMVEKLFLTFHFNSFKGKNVQQLSEEDFNGAQKEIANIKESYINDYNSNEEFKRGCDEYAEEINKFKKNVKNFKKAQERLEEIKKLQEGCSKDLFDAEVDKVEEEIGKKLKADIEDKESCVKKLGWKINSNDLKRKQLEKDIANTEDSVKQLEEELSKRDAIKKKIENLEEKEREIEANFCRITFPGRYTLFY